VNVRTLISVVVAAEGENMTRAGKQGRVHGFCVPGGQLRQRKLPVPSRESGGLAGQICASFCALSGWIHTPAGVRQEEDHWTAATLARQVSWSEMM
jgi:hypothetical protein